MPRRKNSWADDLVLAPWWVSALLALLAYTILPGVLPVAFANGRLVILITFALLAISAMSALRSLRSRSLLNAQTGLDSLRDLSSKRFEDVLAEAYRRQGYHVSRCLAVVRMVESICGSSRMETLLSCSARDGEANRYPCR